MRSQQSFPGVLQLFLVATFLILADGCTMTVRPASHRSSEVTIGEASQPMRTSAEPLVRWSRHHETARDQVVSGNNEARTSSPMRTP